MSLKILYLINIIVFVISVICQMVFKLKNITILYLNIIVFIILTICQIIFKLKKEKK